MQSVLKEILFVWNFQWPPYHSTTTFSPPGHTLHYMVEGEYSLTLNGRRQKVKKGDLVYYAGNESHSYTGGKSHVHLYSINFTADRLPPLPKEKRVFPGNESFAKDFRTIFMSYHQREDYLSSLNSFALLSNILQKIYQPIFLSSMDESRAFWGKIETMVKTNGRYRIKPSEIASLQGISSSTLYRRCISEMGKSPEKMIQELRMSEAKKLLRYSGMNVSEIAAYLGYPRVHEFSREFSKNSGSSPSSYKTDRSPSQ